MAIPVEMHPGTAWKVNVCSLNKLANSVRYCPSLTLTGGICSGRSFCSISAVVTQSAKKRKENREAEGLLPFPPLNGLQNPDFRQQALPPHATARACFRCPKTQEKEDISGARRLAALGSMKWEGVDEKLARMVLEANLDHAADRRRIREAFKHIQLGIDHCLFNAHYTGVKTDEFYTVNSRGLEIFSRSWLPECTPMKALVFFCHGYGDTCTFFFEGIAKKLASSGYGIYAMDYPGFGLSEGLHGYIPSFDTLVNDVVEHFSKIKDNPAYDGLPSFLFGQSMGGAVALKAHFKQPNAWNGAVLVAPMCKMAEDVVPPWPVQQMLICLAKIFPRAKLVPQKDLAEMAFRDLKKREQCCYNVIAYSDKPRLGTALELLRTTQEIENHLQEVSLPLLILHGEADVVTDPSVSKALYEKASSSDKKLCLYKDAYHSLLEGESDETIIRVLDDIISWLDEHTVKAGSC